MPLSRRSTWAAIGIAALTVVGSATSAFADRNMYTGSRMGYGHHYGYHHHMMPRFGHHMRHHHFMHRHMY